MEGNKPTVEAFLEIARSCLEKDGQLQPIFILDSPQGLIYMDLTEVWTAQDKIRTIFMIGQTLGYGYDVKRLWSVNDAYLRVIEAPNLTVDQVRGLLPETGLADDVQAGEAIMVLESAEDGRARGIALPYERTVKLEGTTFEFQEPHVMDAQGIATFSLALFWEGKRRGARLMDRLYEGTGTTPDTIFEDDAMTLEQVARRAARTAATKIFGADITIPDSPA